MWVRRNVCRGLAGHPVLEGKHRGTVFPDGPLGTGEGTLWRWLESLWFSGPLLIKKRPWARQNSSKGSAGETQTCATQGKPPRLLDTSREQLLFAVSQSKRSDFVGHKLATGLWRKATCLASVIPYRGAGVGDRQSFLSATVVSALIKSDLRGKDLS